MFSLGKTVQGALINSFWVNDSKFDSERYLQMLLLWKQKGCMVKESKEELNWKTPPYKKGKIRYNTREFEFIRQHLFWTVQLSSSCLELLCLLYQISEHIIMQITFITILVMSLLPLSRNEANSHFINNWQSQGNTTS